MQEGFVMLYRKLKRSSYYSDSQYVHLWVTLLLEANHKPNKIKINGSNTFVELKEGQLITSRSALALKTNISESKVSRILKSFEIEQQIEQQTFTKYRIITILNWNIYQHREQQNEQQLNSKRTASEQQLNTNNNVNNEKKKNLYVENSQFEEFWNVIHPRAKRCGKTAALKSWNSHVTQNSTEVIRAAIMHSKSKDWLKEDGKYVPMATTWLNNHRWDAVLEEEVEPWRLT